MISDIIDLFIIYRFLVKYKSMSNMLVVKFTCMIHSKIYMHKLIIKPATYAIAHNI